MAVILFQILMSPAFISVASIVKALTETFLMAIIFAFVTVIIVFFGNVLGSGRYEIKDKKETGKTENKKSKTVSSEKTGLTKFWDTKKILFVLLIILNTVSMNILSFILLGWFGYNQRKKYSQSFKKILVSGFLLALSTSFIAEVLRAIASLFIYTQEKIAFNALHGDLNFEVLLVMGQLVAIVISTVIGTGCSILGGMLSDNAPDSPKPK
ncbi:MAG: hypothetical protein ABH986_02250 [archaeon]